MRVMLDGGPGPSIRTVASAILQWAREARQEVFACDSLSPADDETYRPTTHTLAVTGAANYAKPG